MKQITIRGMSAEVMKEIEKEAGKKGLSLNKAVLSLIEKKAGAGGREAKRMPLHHDLDHLFGLWTGKEAREFHESLKKGRRIDAEMWK